MVVAVAGVGSGLLHFDALRPAVVAIVVRRLRRCGVDLLEKCAQAGDDLNGGLHQVNPGALQPAPGGVAQIVEVLGLIHHAPRI